MKPPDSDPTALDRLVETIRRSARYRSLCPDVVRRVAARELARRGSLKEAEQETRSRLHQISGAYLSARPPYGKWLEALRAAPDEVAFHAELRRMMRPHASTSERLEVLDGFYRRTLAPARPVQSILDVACGFNPLALPWMGVEEGGSYAGFDLDVDAAAFLQAAMDTSPYAPRATVRVETRDVAEAPPGAKADIALVLKLLPLLDQPTPQRMAEWLSALRARYALVSFPTRTLGGRNVGMAASHEARFREVLQSMRWTAERIELPNELCFLVELRGAAGEHK
ncbi:MAG TPA: hypothetical protein VKT77_14730 [Chthonomonadaceae bacterium]|nr:hypothetical protein [Chthonomonadaceae bacterium]